MLINWKTVRLARRDSLDGVSSTYVNSFCCKKERDHTVQLGLLRTQTATILCS